MLMPHEYTGKKPRGSQPAERCPLMYSAADEGYPE
jgi:hypothetical protein